MTSTAASLQSYTVVTNQSLDSNTVDIGFHYNASASLAVTTTPTALQMVQLLVPSFVSVSSVSYTGSSVARGTSSNGVACNLPIDSGVILSTGYITNAIRRMMIAVLMAGQTW